MTDLDRLDAPSDDGYPYGEFDAHAWAAEFDRIYPPEKSRPDIDTMLGWFANAIMTGYDKAKNESVAAARASHPRRHRRL